MGNLKNLIFGIGIAGIVEGCSANRNLDIYHESTYTGKIDGDSIKFTREFRKKEIINIMEVRKPNNKVIYYIDAFGKDNLIETVQVNENKNCQLFYNTFETDTSLIKEAQKQFNNYLQKINNSERVLK